MAPKITVTKNGPYLVSGRLPLGRELIKYDENGDSVAWLKGDDYPAPDNCALCRCGQSQHKPFCDGTHAKVDFDGTETASRQPHVQQAETISGPEMTLTDAPRLCSSAGFCHRQGGVWHHTENSDNPESKRLAVEQACHCPSGRLVAWDKQGQVIEPEFEPSISVTEQPKLKVSGPLWVKGGVEIESADGAIYETRNRQTLCRCGQSRNKPFCDSAHITTKFNDGDDSVA